MAHFGEVLKTAAGTLEGSLMDAQPSLFFRPPSQPTTQRHRLSWEEPHPGCRTQVGYRGLLRFIDMVHRPESPGIPGDLVLDHGKPSVLCCRPSVGNKYISIQKADSRGPPTSGPGTTSPRGIPEYDKSQIPAHRHRQCLPRSPPCANLSSVCHLKGKEKLPLSSHQTESSGHSPLRRSPRWQDPPAWQQDAGP